MKVQDRMTPNPYTTSPDTSVGDTWRLMNEHKLSRLPVLDRGKLVGILTRTDFGSRPDLNFRGTSIATRYFSNEQEQLLNKVKVRDILPDDQSLITISPDAYVEQAAKLLRDNKIGGLPVVDDNGKLLGIITQTDVFDAFLDLLAINRKGTRINLRVADTPEALVQIGLILGEYAVKIENLVTMELDGDENLMILRINTTDAKPIVDDFKTGGFKIESVIVRQ
ncbi:MAG: CBS and ACT domain-containing protein [Syntrophomonas sp.]|nr:CBS and ACT domain-containing protein [Syntrophomonas sp.]